MLGLIYLVISSLTGYFLLKIFLSGIFKISGLTGLNWKEIKLANWMVTFPGSFLVGTMVVTWFTYLTAYLLRTTGKPMFYGNLLTFLMFIVFLTVLAFIYRKTFSTLVSDLRKVLKGVLAFPYRNFRTELIFILAITLIWGYFCFHTFHIKNNTIYTGYSVFSDFAPHLAVIRSFSLGANFPTEYPHFPDGTIRYHFLFQFLAGNLEYLGLRLDWAFNLPSILSMVAFLMLLYSLGTILLGSKWIGILASILVFFRSSFAFFTYTSTLKGMALGDIIKTIFNNDKSIGRTLHEDWGLWSQKVYANQRHFAFSLGLMLFTIIILYPLFWEMIASFKSLRNLYFSERTGKPVKKKKRKEKIIEYIKACFKGYLLQKDSWLPQSYKRCIFTGIILGLMGFWNGAVVIALLLVLCIMAVYSKHRLEYLVIAGLSAILLKFESLFFIGSGMSVLSPQLYIGFLAEGKDLVHISKYYIELLGILPFVIITVLAVLPHGGRWLLLAFTMPFLLANTLSLTPDVVVNHKYVMISVILLNIFAAYLIYRLFTAKSIAVRLISITIIITMTLTGFVDLITLYNLDKGGKALTVKVDDPLLLWTKRNVKYNEVFLTDWYSIHPILLAGRSVFLGWPYYAWSAGYDTNARNEIAKRIYAGNDFNEVDKLIKTNKISYVVIDNGNRGSKEYKLNEELFRKNYPLAYEDKASSIAIYKTASD